MDTQATTTGDVYWTAQQIAQHTGQAVTSVRKWCHRYGVKRVPNPEKGRGYVARAADVIAAAQRMPGQGWRRGQYGRSKQ